MTLEELSAKIENLPTVDYWESSPKESLKDRSEFFRSMIQKRLEHCEKQLEEHLYEAKSICSGQVVVWEGGHFSVPVWDHLKQALEQDLRDWNALVWEQIIRQMGREEEHFEPILWDTASEMCLCQSHGIVSELDQTSINRH